VDSAKAEEFHGGLAASTTPSDINRIPVAGVQVEPDLRVGSHRAELQRQAAGQRDSWLFQ